MKKNYIFVLILVSLFSFFSVSYGESGQITNPVNLGSGQTITNIDREDVFNFLGDNIIVPDSYEYINLKFSDIKIKNKLYSSLQKLVYLNSIKNLNIKINKNGNITAYSFYKLAEKVFGIKIVEPSRKEHLSSRFVVKEDLDTLSEILDELKISKDKKGLFEKNDNAKLEEKKEIFKDVYKTLLDEHYDKDKIDQVKYVEGAIEGLTNSIGDKYSVYFPPTESKDFYDTLNGEYEGIGAYVDMETPGIFKIVTPIVGSPSEKAGLKGGDIVEKVDKKEVKKENSVNEVVSWIKGKAGSKVILTINRDGKLFDIEVTRDKIIIKDVEYKDLGNDIYYIQIRSFGDHVITDFKKSLEDLKTKSNIKKVIIDLRNDGGGYLEAVTDILGYFVPLNEPTAVVKYIGTEETSYSRGYNLIDFSKYKLIILQNSGTASASEIMIGTIKDYFKDIVIIGENSYGKGSVQTIRSYKDGSSLKYTIAKWFTGKTQTGIDKIGIKPTIELELNIEDFKKGIDNQLEKAKSIN